MEMIEIENLWGWRMHTGNDDQQINYSQPKNECSLQR